MNVGGIREDLKAYLDGELPAERVEQVRAAIEANPELRAEAEFMARLSQSLQAMSAGPLVSGAAQAAEAARRPRRLWLLTAPGLGTAAASLLVVLVLSALLFPTFNQAKDKARQTAEFARRHEARAGDEAESLQGWRGGRPAAGADTGASAPAETKAKRDATVDRRALAYSALERSVVRSGTLTVRVKNAERAEKRVTALVNGWGGYVENTQSTDLDSSEPTLTMTVRVPEKLFDKAISEFESLGVRTEKTTFGEDVTTQLVDVNQRLKTMRAEEETYRQILRQTRRVGEMLDVQRRLYDIRSEIESLAAQQATLKRLAALSTITLTIEQRPSEAEPPNDPGWAGDAWEQAKKGLLAVLRALGVFAIWLFVYSPIWLPLVFFGWLAAKSAGRRRV